MASKQIRDILDHVRGLVQVYRDVIDSTSSAPLQEIFTNLVEMEESKDRQYARSLLE